MLHQYDEVDRQILVTLATAPAAQSPLTTRDLSQRINVDRKDVYQRCRRLNKKFPDLFQSDSKASDRRLLFFPAIGAVVNKANYEQVGKVASELRAIAHRYPVPRGKKLPPEVKNKLLRDYRQYLSRLEETASPRELPKLQAFEKELMATLGGTFISDVVRCVSLRIFRPQERTWTLLPGNSVVAADGTVRLPDGTVIEPPLPRDRKPYRMAA